MSLNKTSNHCGPCRAARSTKKCHPALTQRVTKIRCGPLEDVEHRIVRQSTVKVGMGKSGWHNARPLSASAGMPRGIPERRERGRGGHCERIPDPEEAMLWQRSLEFAINAAATGKMRPNQLMSYFNRSLF